MSSYLSLPCQAGPHPAFGPVHIYRVHPTSSLLKDVQGASLVHPGSSQPPFRWLHFSRAWWRHPASVQSLNGECPILHTPGTEVALLSPRHPGHSYPSAPLGLSPYTRAPIPLLLLSDPPFSRSYLSSTSPVETAPTRPEQAAQPLVYWPH